MRYWLTLLCLCLSLYSDANPYFPPFDFALLRYGEHQLWYRDRFDKSTREELKDMFWKNKFLSLSQNLYYMNSHPAVKTAKKEPIPKIIHQIWLGGPMPKAYKQWMETWQHIPGWEYRLWTDAEANQFGLANQQLYDNAKNYGERANILRYEILHKFGGLYVDVDMECINVDFFEYAHQNYDFYVAMEPLDHGVAVCNAVIGSIPKHPLLAKMIDGMQTYVETTPSADLPPKTNYFGPIYLSRKLVEYGIDRDYVDVILPPTFFYPFSLRDVLSNGLDSRRYTFSGNSGAALVGRQLVETRRADYPVNYFEISFIATLFFA